MWFTFGWSKTSCLRVHKEDNRCRVLILFIQPSAIPENTTSFCLKEGVGERKKEKKVVRGVVSPMRDECLTFLNTSICRGSTFYETQHIHLTLRPSLVIPTGTSLGCLRPASRDPRQPLHTASEMHQRKQRQLIINLCVQKCSFGTLHQSTVL